MPYVNRSLDPRDPRWLAFLHERLGALAPLRAAHGAREALRRLIEQLRHWRGTGGAQHQALGLRHRLRRALQDLVDRIRDRRVERRGALDGEMRDADLARLFATEPGAGDAEPPRGREPEIGRAHV